jgi:hypothetical protein
MRVSLIFSGTAVFLSMIITPAGGTPRTISDVVCRDNLEFFLDVRIEKTIEIKPVWAPLPASEIADFVPMYYITFTTQVVDICHFGVYRGEKKT